ncbi:sulfotransferase family protein [Sorangium sp. So ce1078]|uniref:sulfotransferase family protein n=1 Tax=Sorangium sp. So ce1078 TaxID=3133329 RepID=UPI003F63C9DB
MDLRHVDELQQVIERLTGFASRVKESSGDATLRQEAQNHLDVLIQLPGVLRYFFIDEGKDSALIRPPDAEISRTPAHPDKQFSCTPIFIIGNRRSGTTLLSYLLNASDGLSALPEAFVAGDIVTMDRLFTTAQRARTALDEPFPRFLLRIGCLIDAIHSEYAASKGKRRWASKELFVPHRLDLLDAIFDYRAQFIYAVRHGFSVAHSCASRFPMRDGLPLNDKTSLDVETYLNEWISNNESTMDFYERNTNRCFLVRYEDFTKNPLSVGKKLFEFLDEPWTDDLVNKKLTKQKLHMMGDNKILATGGKILAAEEPWRSWPQALLKTLGRKANPTLQRLGYEAEG